MLCPYVHRPSFDAMWATLAPELRDDALVLDNTVTNLGAAGSRNVGARQLLDEDIDWLIDISPVTRFGPNGGLDFIELVEQSDGWIMQASTPVNWHLMAWSRRLFERVGLFDENFWPIYGEDGDMAHRVAIASREDGGNRWDCVDVDAWVTMYGHSRKLANVTVDMETLWAYYDTKWGGHSGLERFTRPFDRDVGLAWWPMPPDPLSIYDRVRA